MTLSKLAQLLRVGWFGELCNSEKSYIVMGRLKPIAEAKQTSDYKYVFEYSRLLLPRHIQITHLRLSYCERMCLLSECLINNHSDQWRNDYIDEYAIFYGLLGEIKK